MGVYARVLMALVPIGVLGALLGLFIQLFTDSGTVWVCTEIFKWMVPLALVGLTIVNFYSRGRGRNLAERAADSDTAKAIAEQCGANPFKNPDQLPSWRPGLTRARTDEINDYVLGLARPAAGFYPRPDQLPELPELQIRNLDEWPAVVAEAARNHFNLS